MSTHPLRPYEAPGPCDVTAADLSPAALGERLSNLLRAVPGTPPLVVQYRSFSRASGVIWLPVAGESIYRQLRNEGNWRIWPL